jgi:methylmalonyl-CoA epimerase
MPVRPTFKKVLQVAVVVKNLDKAMKRYWEDFGIGPWSIYTINSPIQSDKNNHGEHLDHAMRMAFTNIGDVGWELIEPLDDKSIYADFLREHGEGLHHVALDVDDYDKALTSLEDKGIGVLQDGEFSGVMYLSAIVEIYSEKPDSFEIPPPEATYP